MAIRIRIDSVPNGTLAAQGQQALSFIESDLSPVDPSTSQEVILESASMADINRLRQTILLAKAGDLSLAVVTEDITLADAIDAAVAAAFA